jgi:hypothetical protein
MNSVEVVNFLLEADEIDPKAFVDARPQLAPQWPEGAVADAITRSATCMKWWFRQDHRKYLTDEDFLGDLGDALADCSTIDFEGSNIITPENTFDQSVARHRMLDRIATEYLNEWFRGKNLVEYRKAHMKVWREIATGLVHKMIPHIQPPPLK